VTAAAKRSAAACLGCALALALLVSLAFQQGSARELDARALNRLAIEAAGGGVASALAALGDPGWQALLVCLLIVGALRWGRPERALAALALVAAANLTTQLLKGALAAPRYEPVLRWEQLGEAAFPSGHVTAVAALVLAALLVVPAPWRRPTAALGAFATAAVGWAVAALHWHAPSDVLGGLLVALTWYFAVAALLCQRQAATARNVLLDSPAEQ
jgi:membrane-associated phospholipid phosphatase